MKKIKITSISMKTTPMDFLRNTETIINVLTNEGTDTSICVFPELCISGYGCEDAFFSSELRRKSIDSLEKILPFTTGRIVVVGLPLYYNSSLYNTSAVLFNGEILGLVPKLHLANTGIHYEKRWFREFQSEADTVSIFGQEVPLGNFLFQANGFSFSIEICEDSWVAHRKSAEASLYGAEIILSTGASHFAFGKQETRRRIFQESSRSQGNIFVYSNLNGNESGRVIFEGGCLITALGEIIQEGPRLHFTDYETTSAVLDLDLVKNHRSRFYRDFTEVSDSNLSKINFDFSPLEVSEPLKQKEKIADLPNTMQDFSDAVSLGLFDYLRKTGSKGFTLSLSGGADSSACAILTMIMKEKAKSELGNDVFQKLNINENDILITIYQSTRNSSEETRKFAKTLAEELRLPSHLEIEIDPVIDFITENISKLTSTNLNWKDHDLALQNIQARARSPIVWLLANFKNHLLLSTGNRSEASVGYTTMDGDSSGSLCPISGVSKTFILKWLHYIAEGNISYLPPLKILTELLEKKPTAELKPPEEAQEDEKDLMPYDLLQKIEFEYVYNSRSDEEIFDSLSSLYPGEEDLLKNNIQKFIQLFKRNQWKRERLPPGFHLDDYSLDSRAYFRFPILSK
ncbi:MAG: NAD(+) synthase [Leptospiraceae bacterium]|nr:NAD(+) synthase [Leptospiraceae bacterium]MCP5511682.1 NAD(+) synthase [Leptospiraceae bacterium]